MLDYVSWTGRESAGRTIGGGVRHTTLPRHHDTNAHHIIRHHSPNTRHSPNHSYSSTNYNNTSSYINNGTTSTGHPLTLKNRTTATAPPTMTTAAAASAHGNRNNTYTRASSAATGSRSAYGSYAATAATSSAAAAAAAPPPSQPASFLTQATRPSAAASTSYSAAPVEDVYTAPAYPAHSGKLGLGSRYGVTSSTAGEIELAAAGRYSSNNTSTPTRRSGPITSGTSPYQRSTTPSGRPSSANAMSPIRPGLLRPHSHALSRPLLVLDLDETLVHASVDPIARCDYSFYVTAGGQHVQVFVLVRPFAHEFLRRMAQLFEVCVFTASLSPYADKVIDFLDPQGTLVQHRLFREHCTQLNGSYTKDLSRLGRPLERLCLVDNSPITYALQPQNGVPILSWFDDPRDNELMRLCPALEYFARCGNFYETARKFGIRPEQY